MGFTLFGVPHQDNATPVAGTDDGIFHGMPFLLAALVLFLLFVLPRPGNLSFGLIHQEYQLRTMRGQGVRRRGRARWQRDFFA